MSDPGRPEPKSSGSGAPVEIIIAPDGRVILTDLPPELQDLVAELNPDDPAGELCPVSADPD